MLQRLMELRASGFLQLCGCESRRPLCQLVRKLRHASQQLCVYVSACICVCVLRALASVYLHGFCVYECVCGGLGVSCQRVPTQAKLPLGVTPAGHEREARRRDPPCLLFVFVLSPGPCTDKSITRVQLHAPRIHECVKQTSAKGKKKKKSLKCATGGSVESLRISKHLWCGPKEEGSREQESPGTLTAASQISEADSEAFYALICTTISRRRRKKKKIAALVFKQPK